MVVRHHTAPFPASEFLIVIGAQTGILGHQTADSRTVACRGTVVELRHTGTGHRRVIDQLIESILHCCGHLFLQGLTAEHERLPQMVCPEHLRPVEEPRHLSLGLPPEVIFAVLGDDVGRLLGEGVAKNGTREVLQIALLVARLDGIRVPGIFHDEVDGHLLGLQVTHIDDPDTVDAASVGQVQLFAEFGDGGGVHPTVVPGAAVHVNMIVESESSLATALKVASLPADIAPVVVAEQQRHVIGHGEARIIVALHLREDSPQLGDGILVAIDLLDDPALTVDDLSERLHVLCIVTLAHRHVAITAHTDGHQVLVGLVAHHTFTEETVQALLVDAVVPGADAVFPGDVLPVGTHHRLVVRGTHHDTVFVRQARTLRVILIEAGGPHRRPQVVGLQPEQQFKDLGIGLGVDATKLVVTPVAERRPLVVDEDATVFHLRRGLDDAPAVVPHLLLMGDRGIGPPVPGRHADALRDLIDAVDGAALVAASDDETTIHHVDEVRLPLAAHLTDVYLLLPDQLVDQPTLADGADDDASILYWRDLG